MVVILGVRRLTGGRAGGLTHYAGHEPGILNIFSKYSLKNTSNILGYARIYSNISLSRGRKGLSGEASGRTDNPDPM
jgi:hypothetical protein